ncbi:Uncharacterized protein TCM_027566 [Theobroma cacao]|uniref:Uncharacterized protein n=1 Tax=Theobroma cacao TaxID=3641 RepID=A0A061G9E0_THECC|nr:Uncharacterized protein TCM_027566 [Theobroma cacao]
MSEIGIALCVDMPAALTNESTTEQKEFFAKRDIVNQMCLHAIKRTISKHLLSGLQTTETTKELYEAIGERYQKSNKYEARNLMSELTRMKYDSV